MGKPKAKRCTNANGCQTRFAIYYTTCYFYSYTHTHIHMHTKFNSILLLFISNRVFTCFCTSTNSIFIIIFCKFCISTILLVSVNKWMQHNSCSYYRAWNTHEFHYNFLILFRFSEFQREWKYSGDHATWANIVGNIGTRLFYNSGSQSGTISSGWNSCKFDHHSIITPPPNKNHFFCVCVCAASTAMWFSRRKKSRTIKCFRSIGSKNLYFGSFDESIGTNRSDRWDTAKPSIAKTAFGGCRTVDGSATSEYSHWRNAIGKYGTKWFVCLLNSIWKQIQRCYEAFSYSGISIHCLLHHQYTANRSVKFLQWRTGLLPIEIRSKEDKVVRPNEPNALNHFVKTARIFLYSRYTAAHTLDVYSEVAAICRPPLVLSQNEVGSFKKAQTPSTGYIISVFKVFEGDDGERFEKNWLYWTGARMLYRYVIMIKTIIAHWHLN